MLTMENKTFLRRLVTTSDDADMRVRLVFTAMALAAFMIFVATHGARAEDSRGSEEILATLNADGKLIVATMKKKIPDPKLYKICASGEGNVRAKVIAVTTYLASASKLDGEPWTAGDATVPYFRKYCEELAEAELERELAN